MATISYVTIAVLCAMACTHLVDGMDHFTSKELIKANNKFAIELYNVLKGDGNLFISPYNINSALGLIFMMSKGPTAEQLASVMHFNSSDYQTVASAFRHTIEALDKTTLSSANSVFIDNSMTIKQEFKDDVKEYMGAKSENVDLGKGIEESRQYINNWVSEQTNHMITDLLPKDFSHSGPKAMVLCSAIHFKSDWIEEFETTRKGNFHSLDGTVQEIDMMYSARKHFGFGWLGDLMAKGLRIDYKGKKQSMMLLLPEGKTTLDQLEAKLAKVDIITDVFDKIQPGDRFHHDIQVTMPKFKFEYEQKLKDALKKMGLERVFTASTADFTRASDLRNLEVSEMYHKAAIHVDEKGTEAAAATAAMSLVVSGPPSFRADRPFLFAVVDRATSSIVFLGRFVKPPSGSDISPMSLPPMFRADRPFMFAIIDHATSSVVFVGRYVKPPVNH